MSDERLLQSALNTINVEAACISALADNLGEPFINACRLIEKTNGKVVCIGVGKSGHIGQKIAASFSSTGTPAFTIHPNEAGHGDLGAISSEDLVLCISNSGESDEILSLIPHLKRQGNKLIALTGNLQSSLTKQADVSLHVGVKKEACPHNLAPTASTTAALVMGDALAISLLDLKGFTPSDFARSHPLGMLGRRLNLTVGDIMKKGEDVPTISPEKSLLSSLLEMSEKALGIVFITEQKNLLGVFTDGDLRRLLETSPKNFDTLKIKTLMQKKFISIDPDVPVAKAIELMNNHQINALAAVKGNALVGAFNTHTLMQARVI